MSNHCIDNDDVNGTETFDGEGVAPCRLGVHDSAPAGGYSATGQFLDKGKLPYLYSGGNRNRLGEKMLGGNGKSEIIK